MARTKTNPLGSVPKFLIDWFTKPAETDRADKITGTVVVAGNASDVFENMAKRAETNAMLLHVISRHASALATEVSLLLKGDIDREL